VSIAIIIIISVVAVTTHSSMVDKTNNSKIVSDITTLENSITSYKNETSKFPEPE
jgi:type II secretory pathway pseudopilin PulG